MENVHDNTYLNLCRQVLDTGELQPNRTGISAISSFGAHCVYDLQHGFPLLTTKKLNFEKIKAELFWFLKGSTNVNDLPEKHRDIWAPWQKDAAGNLGPIYGKQWVDWRKQIGTGINQIQDVIDRLKNNPTDRRLIVSAWNVSDLDDMALPPCHVMFQLKAYPPYLDLQMYQRSCDLPIGVPYNIASYTLLLMLIAKEVGLIPRRFHHSLGDHHIYVDQIEPLREQLSRAVPEKIPQVTLSDKPFWGMTEEDVVLHNYKPLPFIKFPVAV